MEKEKFTEVQSRKAKKKAKVLAQVAEDQQNRGSRRQHQGDPASPSQGSPQKKPAAPNSPAPTPAGPMDVTPTNVPKFVQEAEQLKHADRIAKAATTGRDLKGSKDLRALIDAMRTV